MLCNLRCGRLYVQCYAALADRFLKADRPLSLGLNYHGFCFLSVVENRQLRGNTHLNLPSRYKLRPKFHAFHCQLILHADSGAKLNAKYGSCFNEEDLIGKITGITKDALHPTTLGKRVLQRWLLQMNSYLAERC